MPDTLKRLLLLIAHGLAAIPLPGRWMYKAFSALYALVFFFKRVGGLNDLAKKSIAHAYPEWAPARVSGVFQDFWRSQAYAAIFESPIIARKKYVDLKRRLDPGLAAGKSIAIWDGVEHVEATRDQAVIFSVGHMHPLEIAVIAISLRRPLYYLSKKPKDRFVAAVVEDNRRSVSSAVGLNRRNMREVYRRLNNKEALLVLGDQYVHPVSPVIVNFFNTPIHVQPTFSKLATGSGAAVIPVYVRRTRDMRYAISFKAPLELSPTDHQKNSQLIFWHYEQCARQAPEQYIWNHNRFFR